MALLDIVVGHAGPLCLASKLEESFAAGLISFTDTRIETNVEEVACKWRRKTSNNESGNWWRWAGGDHVESCQSGAAEDGLGVHCVC
jgi:hypothetical protein